jgi:hypothetical protein
MISELILYTTQPADLSETSLAPRFANQAESNANIGIRHKASIENGTSTGRPSRFEHDSLLAKGSSCGVGINPQKTIVANGWEFKAMILARCLVYYKDRAFQGQHDPNPQREEVAA